MRLHLIKKAAATWATLNDKLGSGLLGFEQDTGRAKVGDGVSTWSQLRYLTDLPIVTALPTASAALRGQMVLKNNSTGVADTIHVCRETATDGTFAWVTVTVS